MHDQLRKYIRLVENNSIASEAVLDTHGWGAVPKSVDVDYFGIQVKMKPSIFLKLALPLEANVTNPELYKHMDSGGKIAFPWLDVAEPEEWLNGDFSDVAKVRTHEGRNRMTKWMKLKGDDPIQVNLFLKYANRRKYVTPEMIERLSQGMISEYGQMISGPLFDPGSAK